MRYLLLEDDVDDAALVEAVLNEEGLEGEIVRVAELHEFQQRDPAEVFDVALAGHWSSHGDTAQALRRLRERDADIPCIALYGALGERHEIDTRDLGVGECVPWNRLSRLAPAVRRALAGAGERRRLRCVEAIAIGAGRDMAEIHRVQRELTARARQQTAVAELGTVALESADLTSLFDLAVGLVARALEVELAKVLELTPDGQELELRAGVGWKPGLVGTARVHTGVDSQAGFTLATDATVVVESWEAEQRFSAPELLLAHGVESGMSVVIRGRERPFGVLGAHTRTRRRFSRDDAAFMAAIANVLAAAIERADSDAALRTTRSHLRQSHKMDAIGQLAGGVAHDFNNLLTAIMGFAQLGENECGQCPAMRHHLAEIRRAGQRAADVTRRLLAFGRRQDLAPCVFDPNQALQATAPLLQRLLGEHLTLALELDPTCGSVEIDPSQFDQLILNLVLNARDAMPRGGQITISTSSATPDRAHAVAGLEPRPGEHVCIRVRDQGHGMDADTLAHIFEPFFTTKPIGSGTGLGLAMVYGIVKQYGGSMRVDSACDRGTTFELYLARVAAPASSATPAAPGEVAFGGDETVLLVEDDDAIRALVSDVLGAKGYDVLTASTGAEALEIVARHAARIDLLVTDLLLPATSGSELADELLAARKTDRVLFMTGCIGPLPAGLGARAMSSGVLDKPFTTQQLLRAVRAILDRVPG